MDRGAWQATVHRAQTHMGKCGQEGLFCLPYINPNVKEMNIIKLVQMIFNAWFGYFEYASYLSWYNIDCSQLMSQFDHYHFRLVSATMEHHAVRKNPGQNFTNHSRHFWSVTVPSQYTAEIFFCVFKLHFYLSWNNKASYAKMLLFSFIFNTKMATQKFTNF